MRAGRGGRRPGAGRKPVDSTIRKTVQMVFRITTSEKKRVVEIYKSQGFSGFSDYFRHLLHKDIAKHTKED